MTMRDHIDAACRRWVQAAYTYAWDRWGIYVGTVRFVLATCHLGGWCLTALAAALHSWAIVASFGFLFTFVFGWLCMGAWNDHGRRERAQQKRGALRTLNEAALNLRQDVFWRIGIAPSMMFVLTAMTIINWRLGLVFLLTMVTMTLYAYTQRILVHPRNDARFARFEGAASLGAAP